MTNISGLSRRPRPLARQSRNDRQRTSSFSTEIWFSINDVGALPLCNWASRKLAFCDFFFEIATSCNSLDYRELQHRIFKDTSKN